MENKISQAIILSAGLGTRLRPITEKIPKVMLPIEGKPLLEHHFNQFKKYGVKEFFINLHYLPEIITNYFENGKKLGIKIHYHFEPKLLGTAGGIKNFEKKLKKNFFVIYGDIFSLVNYSKMAKAFFQKRDAIGIELIGDTDHPFDSDLVEVGKDLKFLKIYPKPHKKLPENYKAMRGVYIFNKRILNYIPAKKYYEIDHHLLPKILKQKENFYGYQTKDYLKDIGTIARYREAQNFYSLLKKS